MSLVLQQLDGRGVLTLTLNRPDVHNAFGPELIDELTHALQQAGANPSARIVVLTGSGKSFSAGADIHWMRGMIHASEEENERDALHLAALMRTLNYLAQPTVAMINGHALGGGLGLVACCDMSVTVDSASFGLTETTLGLVPSVI
jgi:methylglutaconyl-CoA hydratase